MSDTEQVQEETAAQEQAPEQAQASEASAERPGARRFATGAQAERPAQAGASRGRRGGGRFGPRRKVCVFCADNIGEVDYKDIARLRRHLSERAKIEPRRKMGTCAKHQRSLTVAIKRARHLALLPFVAGTGRS